MFATLAIIYIGSLIWCSVIAVKKGKTTMMIIGWLVCSPLIYIAAARIAKPTSEFARKNYVYEPMKMEVSKIRFPKEAYIIKQLEETNS